MKTITPTELKNARLRMELTCQELADWLYLPGRWAERNIRRWEDGTYPIPGPVIKALELSGWIK